MTTAYQNPTGAVFVEPTPDGKVRIAIRQYRTDASIEVESESLEELIGHIISAARAGEPPMMDVGPTSDVHLVCKKCAAMVHPKNMDFHNNWHASTR